MRRSCPLDQSVQILSNSLGFRDGVHSSNLTNEFTAARRRAAKCILDRMVVEKLPDEWRTPRRAGRESKLGLGCSDIHRECSRRDHSLQLASAANCDRAGL